MPATRTHTQVATQIYLAKQRLAERTKSRSAVCLFVLLLMTIWAVAALCFLAIVVGVVGWLKQGRVEGTCLRVEEREGPHGCTGAWA